MALKMIIIKRKETTPEILILTDLLPQSSGGLVNSCLGAHNPRFREEALAQETVGPLTTDNSLPFSESVFY